MSNHYESIVQKIEALRGDLRFNKDLLNYYYYYLFNEIHPQLCHPKTLEEALTPTRYPLQIDKYPSNPLSKFRLFLKYQI